MPAMDACPCGSGDPFDKCCQPYIEGEKLPPTAAATMKSRYSAFATGNVDYIVSSHHRDTRDDVDREEVEEWSTSSEWHGIEILHTEDGGVDDETGIVDFHARYSSDGVDHDHLERSTFVRDPEEGNAWRFYAASTIPQEPIVREEPKVGRNDPCPCGSGKKYKKCHGAAA